MSYLEQNKKSIIELINNGVIFMIGEISIIPRNSDLPNHYIKKDSQPGTMDHSRMNIILNANDIFQHDHKVCGNDKITYHTKNHKGKHRTLFQFSCKRSRFVIEKSRKGYILVTAFEMKGYDIIKNNKPNIFKNEIICTESIEQILKDI